MHRSSCPPPLTISKILTVKEDLSWEVYVENYCIQANNNPVLNSYPSKITATKFIQLINAVHSGNVCVGNYNEQFIRLARSKKGHFYSVNGKLVAVLEESFCFTVEGIDRCGTVRHVKCEVLLVEDKTVCTVCIRYRNTLRALISKAPQSPQISVSIYTNIRRLRTPQRPTHIASLRKAIRNKNRQLKRLRAKVQQVLEGDSIPLDDELSGDVQKVISQHKVIEKDDFRRIFWEQQVLLMHSCTEVNSLLMCALSCFM